MDNASATQAEASLLQSVGCMVLVGARRRPIDQQGRQRRPFQKVPGGQRPQRPLQATDWTNGVVAAAAARLAAPLVGAASALHASAPAESTAATAISVSISLRICISFFAFSPRADFASIGC